jgi:NAD(P)-dependent dehydrogenase (short-subunit alcohol dehydrogenase family)
MQRLENKTALITGAAAGIGAAAAKLFVKQGARVFLVDTNEEGLRTTVQAAGSGQASCTVANVADESSTQEYVRLAKNYLGGIDIALLNAGIEGEVHPIADCPTEVFDQVLAVNLKGVWLGLKYIMPVMAAGGGGSIVLTSSTAGVKGRAGLAPYVASKHGVIGLMRSAAQEGAPDGIRINTVNPSPVETRMMRSLEQGFSPKNPERFRKKMADRLALGRYAEPAEIANLMLFLASDEASYVTGSVNMIDGGTTAFT